MDEDASMLMLIEWVERTLEEMDRERETELRDQDGTPITPTENE